MRKNILLIIFSACLLASCTTQLNTWNADSNIRKIRLGMQEDQVITIMGDTYKVIAARQEGQNYIETLGFLDTRDGIYKLKFTDGVLTEWDYTEPHKHYEKESEKSNL